MSLLDDSFEQPTVIDVNQLSSDIEADLDGTKTKDDEIDLLNDKDAAITGNSGNEPNSAIYKTRYREVVHAIRHLNRKLQTEREQHENQENQLKKQVAALKDAAGDRKNQNPESISLVNVASEGEIASKHNSQRQSSKLRDLEKLMAKCKESLKAKNQQLKILKDSLSEVDKFKEYIDGFKGELHDLRQAHETWTLSIAENKRVMHQEIENKNIEIDKLKAEIKDIQAQLKDSNNKSLQLKSNIQNLESRMVSTSAAHQKERESLTRELVAAKNNAIKQLQKDHDLQLERVKLDLERSLENLKLELLVKDEQIFRNAEREQELQEQNCSLKTDLEATKGRLNETIKELSELRSIKEDQARRISDLENLNAELKTQGASDTGLKSRNDELETNNQELLRQIDEITNKFSLAEKANAEITNKLSSTEKTNLDLNKKLSSLEAINVDLNKNLSLIEGTSQDLTKKLSSVEEINVDLTKKLSSIEGTNADLTNKLSSAEKTNADLVKKLSSVEKANAHLTEKLSSIEKTNLELDDKLSSFEKANADLTKKLTTVEETNVDLKNKLDQSEKVSSEQLKDCTECAELKVKMKEDAERYEQTSFELKTKLDLMTTANSDLEKVFRVLQSECEQVSEAHKFLKAEFDELTKRNETISQVVQENEAEMQNQQEQIEQLKSTKQQLEARKRENSSLTSSLAQVSNELNDKMDDLQKSQLALEALKKRLSAVEQEAQSISQSSKELKEEKDSLAAYVQSESKRRTDLEQQLIVSILAAMKNLETPETSPGSDKTYHSDVPNASEPNEECNLPDPVRLAEKLVSLALDRSTAYMTSNQRLQAVLLDNTMINEEIQRLKEELNSLNKEKTNEVLNSLQEVERLRTENQALVHDQKAYDDQIASLESEIEQLKHQITESMAVNTSRNDACTLADDGLANQLELKEREVEQLKQTLANKERAEQENTVQHGQVPANSGEVPDPTEFKYLKNIVYQFMMGKEPTTLARVISAVFKFEQEQIEQICKVQEAIHQASG